MPTALLRKGRGFQEGYLVIVTPETAPLRWLTLGRLGVVAPRPYAAVTAQEEQVFVLLRGSVMVECEGLAQSVVGRRSAFAGGPTLICLPPDTHFQITATDDTADLVVVSAPEIAGQTPRVIGPEEAPQLTVGASNWTRTVWPGTSLVGGTRHLMVGETLNPPGGWSSYPPHKHDVDDPPYEAVYEEVYFYSIHPAGGFGLQRVYERRQESGGLDEVYVVEDGDVVVIPRGYHPVVAAPGYQLSYVWALRGEGRRYGAWSTDPAFAWLRDVEPLFGAR